MFHVEHGLRFGVTPSIQQMGERHDILLMQPVSLPQRS